MKTVFKQIRLLWIICTVNLVLLFIPMSYLLAQDPGYYPGLLRFETDTSYIYFGPTVKGLVFDTSECVGCKQQLPSWRFLGDLKIDSLRYIDTTIQIEDSIQIGDVRITSPGLMEKLEILGASRLVKAFKRHVLHDTLYWDSIRQIMHVRKDLSLSFMVYFDTTISLDSAKQILHGVPGLEGVNGIPIPVYDENDQPTMKEIETYNSDFDTIYLEEICEFDLNLNGISGELSDWEIFVRGKCPHLRVFSEFL
jgi:hypothetical protein